MSHLFLNDCSLVGTIPSEIGLMTNLMAMGLYGNFLTGTIPDSIGNLENICKFALRPRIQPLSGRPSHQALLFHTDVLYMDDNLLTGEIMSSIGKLTKLGKSQCTSRCASFQHSVLSRNVFARR